jgi:membrane-associated phospholipid phosphatase
MIAAWILASALVVPRPPVGILQAPTGPAAPVARQSAARQGGDRPIAHVFQNLGRDLRALGSVETGAVLLAGGGAAALVHRRDARVAAWVQRQPPASYPGVGNAIGNGLTQAGAAVALWITGEVAGRGHLAAVGSDLIRAQVLDGVLTTTLKVSVDRRRPDGGAYSFPSGHTSSTFATATIIQSHFGWIAGAAGYGVASFVGWSRVRSNHHYLSDVVFGAAVGAISGRAVVRSHAGGWTVAPIAEPDGLALIVSRP